MARADLDAARGDLVIFDRGLIDAAVDLRHREGIALEVSLGGPSPYDDPVFLAPPWPEIYVTDAERQHGLQDATEEYDRLVRGLADLGHNTILLPRLPVEARRDFVLNALL
jgi:predicted ATPase